MVNRLPSWVFMALAMIVMGFALFPLVRAALGIDETIGIQFLTVVSLLIAGLMCGLTGMLLLLRRQPHFNRYLDKPMTNEHVIAAQMHGSGLLLFTGIPLANFLLCYFLWVKNRHRSEYLDYQGREALCFQVTIYLYLMLCLFMAYIIFGLLVLPLLLIYHLIVSVVAIFVVLDGKPFRYPANIAIIQREPMPVKEAAQQP